MAQVTQDQWRTKMSADNNKKMGKIRELFWDQYRKYSYEASKIGRQLAFGEGAIAWFFYVDDPNFQGWILTIFIFLILFFGLDVIQYLVGAYINKKEAKKYEDIIDKISLEDIKRMKDFNQPIVFIYFLKFTILLISTTLLCLMILITFICDS